MNIQAIIDHIDLVLEKSNQNSMGPVDANKSLAEVDLLKDSKDRPGLPLRNILRKGLIPHAYQTNGFRSSWVIPHSRSKDSLGYKFVDTLSDLIVSVLEFYSKPDLYKNVVGNAPIYFIHYYHNETHKFGLSKFCAFKNITVEEYLSYYRSRTSGGNTQKHLSWLANKNWVPINQVNNEIAQAFEDWIVDFFPNYNIDNASFITIPEKIKPTEKQIRNISLEKLLKIHEQNSKTGEVGELIAKHYEINRLKESGIKNAEDKVKIISHNKANAGYDIVSDINIDIRYIEVKSSTQEPKQFFISDNEIVTLRRIGPKAYIYLVKVDSVEKETGDVVKVINDPAKFLEENATMKPVAFKVEL